MRLVRDLLDRLHPTDAPQASIALGPIPDRTSLIVFPGSFNPPTIAHLALLKQAQHYARAHEPMSLYAAFSKLTVDKETLERPLLLERVLLLSHVLERRLPETGILLFNRGLYVEQAQALRGTFPGVKRILFLLGYDKIVQILDPRYYHDRDASLALLFSLAELLVVPRNNFGKAELDALVQQPQNSRFASSIHALPFSSLYRDISSTHVRRGDGDYARQVPREVLHFMRVTHAYDLPVSRADGSLVDRYDEHVKRLERAIVEP